MQIKQNLKKQITDLTGSSELKCTMLGKKFKWYEKILIFHYL